jgi:Domain of unknown function (DUF4258)
MSKKHFSQMSPRERQEVAAYISKLAIKTTRSHYIDRATEREFTAQEVRDAITTGDVIEVHNDTPGDLRALVRDDNGTCVVISLRTGEVITVFYNHPTDTHDTLDWGKYRWQVDLTRELAKLK